MTNKYLVKLAASLKDEKDVAKSFAQTSAAGYAGHIVGMAVGGVGGALLAAKSKRFGNLATRVVNRAKNFTAAAQATRAGKWIGKHTLGGGPAGVAGAVAGGIIGEEAAQYAGVRHGVMKAKKDQQEKRAEEKKKKDPVLSAAKAGIGSVVAGQVAGTASMIPNMSQGKRKFSKHETRSIRSYLRENKLRNVKFEKGNSLGVDAHFRLDDGINIGRTAPKGNWAKLKAKYQRPIVRSPKGNFNVLMHELGHAKDYANKSPLKTKIMQGTAATTRRAGVPAGIALGAAALSNEKTEKYAPAIAALPGLPVIHSEFSANRNAFKHIKKTLGKKKALGYAASMALPMASYIGTYGAAALGTHAAGKAMRHNRKQND